MLDSTVLSTLMPILVPFGAALIVWIIPFWTRPALGRRWFCIAALIGTGVALALARTGEQGRALIYVSPPALLSSTHVTFEWGQMGKGLGLIMVTALVISHLVAADKEISRLHALLSLALIAGALGVFSATSLLAHCLAWFVLDVVLLALGVARVPEENIPYVMRRSLLQLFATLLVVAALLLDAQQLGHGTIAQLRGPALVLMVTAVLIRLGIFPLPGSAKQRWESFLIAVCVGGYLWLQVIPIATAHLVKMESLVWLGWITVALTGMVAASMPSRDAIPYLVLQNVGLVVLASLNGQSSGLAMSYAAIIQIVLFLIILRMDAAIVTFGRWGRLPLLIALASLTGTPLTIGFGVRWHTLAALDGQIGWLMLAILAFVLSANAIWRLARQSFRRVQTDTQTPSWHSHLALGSSVCAALGIVLLGINLNPWTPDWMHLLKWLPLPAGRASTPAGTSLMLFMAAFALPTVIGYFTALYREWAPEERAQFAPVIVSLELNWFYSGIELLIAQIRRLGCYLLAILEESLYMGWILLCSIITLLLLTAK